MRILRSGFIYTVANVATSGLPLLLLPLLTRAMAPAEYGQVVAFALITLLSGAFAGLNVHAALSVMWFRREADDMQRVVAGAMAVAAVTTLIIAPLVAGVLAVWPRIGAGLEPQWGALAALTAGANVVVQARLRLWQAQDKPLMLAALQFGVAALNLGLSLLAVLVLGFGADGRNAAFALSTLFAALVGFVALSRGREMAASFDRAHAIDVIRFSAPLTLHILASAVLSTADRWMVSIRLDADALGIYGAGAQLGMVMAILGDAFVKAYAPWFYARLRADTDEDRLWATGAAYAAIPAFFLVAACVGLTLQLMAGVVLGAGYDASASLLPWFMVGGAFNGVYLAISSLYFFSHRTGLLAMVTMTAGVIGLGVTALLTAALGMTGAAMGYAAAQAVLGVLAFIMAVRTFDLPWSQGCAALRLLMDRARSGFGLAKGSGENV